MFLKLSSENQIELLSSIVKSTGEMVKLIRSGIKLSMLMEDTFEKIFGFLETSLPLIPDVLVFSGKSGFTKEKLLESFETMKFAKDNFDVMPNEFFKEWDKFQNNWDIFAKILNEVKNSQNTIYLSLN